MGRMSGIDGLQMEILEMDRHLMEISSAAEHFS